MTWHVSRFEASLPEVPSSLPYAFPPPHTPFCHPTASPHSAATYPSPPLLSHAFSTFLIPQSVSATHPISPSCFPTNIPLLPLNVLIHSTYKQNKICPLLTWTLLFQYSPKTPLFPPTTFSKSFLLTLVTYQAPVNTFSLFPKPTSPPLHTPPCATPTHLKRVPTSNPPISTSQILSKLLVLLKV